jgi:hypothetical protein
MNYNQNITVCGADCSVCKFLNNPCNGCRQDNGKPFWINGLFEICPIYDCAVEKNHFYNCGECELLPCKIFFELKDPDSSEEEHLNSINKRVSILKQ